MLAIADTQIVVLGILWVLMGKYDYFMGKSSSSKKQSSRKKYFNYLNNMNFMKITLPNPQSGRK
jgi:hypothetical protein